MVEPPVSVSASAVFEAVLNQIPFKFYYSDEAAVGGKGVARKKKAGGGASTNRRLGLNNNNPWLSTISRLRLLKTDREKVKKPAAKGLGAATSRRATTPARNDIQEKGR